MAKNLSKAFADRLRDLRSVRSWTQDDLAERAGLSSDSIRRMETGRMSPTLATLQKLALGFGVEIAKLVEGVDRRRKRGDVAAQLSDFMATKSDRDAAMLLRVAHALFDSDSN
jgi:transcriptional regulator with XRE-family HTH domain